jgi:hypothetical protein
LRRHAPRGSHLAEDVVYGCQGCSGIGTTELRMADTASA